MKIPKTVKILGQDWKVRLVKDIAAATKKLNKDSKFKKDECAGLFLASYSIIFIDNTITKQQQEVTLIHEIIEVLNSELALRLKHVDIERLETGLYQVITENNFWRK